MAPPKILFRIDLGVLLTKLGKNMLTNSPIPASFLKLSVSLVMPETSSERKSYRFPGGEKYFIYNNNNKIFIIVNQVYIEYKITMKHL